MLREESNRLNHDKAGLAERIKDNHEKIKLNNQLPYLVGNIVEVLDVDPDEEEEEDGEPGGVGQGRPHALGGHPRGGLAAPAPGGAPSPQRACRRRHAQVPTPTRTPPRRASAWC